mmetsp:Transcript_4555/g.10970  ORF Transcript_4555/g.10970 Transcript_4555/m.10970 type:complete len:231 (-) Transcript_4555:672-1364(-)
MPLKRPELLRKVPDAPLILVQLAVLVEIGGHELALEERDALVAVQVMLVEVAPLRLAVGSARAAAVTRHCLAREQRRAVPLVERVVVLRGGEEAVVVLVGEDAEIALLVRDALRPVQVHLAEDLELLILDRLAHIDHSESPLQVPDVVLEHHVDHVLEPDLHEVPVDEKASEGPVSQRPPILGHLAWARPRNQRRAPEMAENPPFVGRDHHVLVEVNGGEDHVGLQTREI